MTSGLATVHRYTWPAAQLVALVPASIIVLSLGNTLDTGLVWMEAFAVVAYYTFLLMMTSLSLYMASEGRPHPEVGYLFLLPAVVAALAWWQLTTGSIEWKLHESSWTTSHYVSSALIALLTIGAWLVHYKLYANHYATLVVGWAAMDKKNKNDRSAAQSDRTFRSGSNEVIIGDDD